MTVSEVQKSINQAPNAEKLDLSNSSIDLEKMKILMSKEPLKGIYFSAEPMDSFTILSASFVRKRLPKCTEY